MFARWSVTFIGCTYIVVDGVMRAWCCDAFGNCILQ